LADASGRPVEVSPVLEATTLGAAFLAGMAIGTWAGWDEIAGMWEPARVVEPRGGQDRDRWREAVARSREWYPDLSSLEF
jgi:glycerol kinase